ncbi:MAG: inorganic pyrophosphatase [bacterium]|nr:inorganic pyrophosphatase [bacterium]
MLGRQVSGRIDRPLGTRHSVYKNLCYPLNYGYVEGVFGGDGEEQDIYLLGEDKPVESFCGTVVAVVHRFNDVEDKWVVDASKRRYSKEEIQKALDFQEKYFYSEIYVL